MKNIIFLILLFFFFSCESEPIKSPVHDGVQFEQHIFKLDGNIETYQDVADSINTGLGELLVSGTIIDNNRNDNESNTSTIKTLLSFDLSKLFDNDWEICNSVVSYETITISLFSNIDLSEIDTSVLKVRLLPLNYIPILEDDGWVEYGDHELTDEIIACNGCVDLDKYISEDSEKELIIKLPDNRLDASTDSTMAILCENNLVDLLIEYTPIENNYIEWYSSQARSLTKLPAMNLDYIVMESVDTTEYQFSLVNFDNIDASAYYISDELSDDWSTIYFSNINALDLISGEIDTLIDFNNVIIDSPIINSSNDSTKVDLGILKIKLNSDAPLDSIPDNILLALKNAKAYFNTSDPSGDNYDPADSSGTDGNAQYDVLLDAVGDVADKEEFNDFGFDNCENQYEDGNGGCCDEECVYNNEGTENNDSVEWEDSNGNDIWDVGEGEKWEDIGSDGCSDEYEDGNGECTTIELSTYDSESNIDPNQDNYNIDPVGDDYDFDDNPEGTENNGILDWIDCDPDGIYEADDGLEYIGICNNSDYWDSLIHFGNGEYDDEEEGELWFDYGLDGLPNTGDEGESNNAFEFGFEYFFDYGTDMEPSEDEEGYCGTSNCSEGNESYDAGELVEDFGEDTCPDELEDGNGGCTTIELSTYDPESNIDPNQDNYNIDPNGDNYNSSQDSYYEGNSELNWTDCNQDQTICDDDDDWDSSMGNGIWNDGEGEQWFDYGYDHTADAYEQYLPENQIIVSMGTNSYDIGVKDNFESYTEDAIPEYGDNQVALWISSIHKNEDEDDVYELTISIYSERELNGVQFSLGHPTIGSNLMVTWSEEYERHYDKAVAGIILENSAGGDSLIEIVKDISVYPLFEKDSYSETLSNNVSLINYSYDIFCKIESNDFKSFINDSLSSGVVSGLSKLVIPINTSMTQLSDIAALQVDLGLTSDVSEDEYSISSTIGPYPGAISFPFGLVNRSDSQLEIPIAHLIQYHLQKDIPFEGFTLKNNSESNIFNSLYLENNGGYIYLVVEK